MNTLKITMTDSKTKLRQLVQLGFENLDQFEK